jgi:SNF2 family DNA or RNA helicase
MSLQVFLLSTQAGSVGINLVAANRMIVMDEHFNPVNNAQVRTNPLSSVDSLTS